MSVAQREFSGRASERGSWEKGIQQHRHYVEKLIQQGEG